MKANFFFEKKNEYFRLKLEHVFYQIVVMLKV